MYLFGVMSTLFWQISAFFHRVNFFHNFGYRVANLFGHMVAFRFLRFTHLNVSKTMTNFPSPFHSRFSFTFVMSIVMLFGLMMPSVMLLRKK